jgi:hypothetical protein
MPLKCLYYRQKMIQGYFTVIKFYLLSLGGGNVKKKIGRNLSDFLRT